MALANNKHSRNCVSQHACNSAAQDGDTEDNSTAPQNVVAAADSVIAAIDADALAKCVSTPQFLLVLRQVLWQS